MPRDLAWNGCVNVRDLGGFATPAGTTACAVYVRADNVRNLSPDGWRTASEYGIRTILDLRSDPECAADPPADPRFTHRRLSLFDHFDGDETYRRRLVARVANLPNGEKYRALYREALDLDAPRFGEAFAALAEADGGVVFHCVHGKDRTGLLAALLLRLVDVRLEEVEADYVRSGTRLTQTKTAPHHDASAPARVITHVVEDTEEQYGSVSDYLLRAGASQEHLERIRRRFVRGEGA